MLIQEYFKAQGDLAREIVNGDVTAIRVIDGRKVTYYEIKARKVGLNKVRKFKKFPTVDLERR